MTQIERSRVDPSATDEELIGLLASGRAEACGPLHARYAPLIFGIAGQAIGHSSAEEVVQEVFLTVWRKAATFDRQRGAFRAWILTIAHNRILNEIRRRGRRPTAALEQNGAAHDHLFEPGPEPDEAAWYAYRRATIRAAVAALPATQRQALSLAFFEELTHEQIAEFLHVPLGTAKTRIRAGLQKLRVFLAPLVALVLVGTLVVIGLHDRAQQTEVELQKRALVLVTSSEVKPLRLAAAPGVAQETHGSYRGLPGVPLAVLKLSRFAPSPSGQAYQAWVRHGERWTSLGTTRPDLDGNALLIARSPVLAQAPGAVQVTVEPNGGSRIPTGRQMIIWTRP
jgi:RNA polymerase sigma-70 factor (ECF subfamily)